MEKTKKSLGIVAIVMTFVLLAGVVGYVVYAAITQSFNFGGKVSFEAEGVNATVEATGWTNCTIGGSEYSDEQTILPKIVYSTDKGLVDTSGVSAWEDLDVVITDSPATLTFKVTNDSSDTALDVEIGEISYTNTSTNEIKIESDVESETVEAGESLSITITFTVSDTSYGAEISDFNIPVTLTKSEAVVATVGDFSYTLNESNSTATVTSYTGTETYVTIPSTIDVDDSSVSGEAIVSANATTTYSVTKIASGAFASCTTITRILIPASIESIGETAFSGCTNLTTIWNASSITINAEDYGTSASVTTSTPYTVTLSNIAGYAVEGEESWTLISDSTTTVLVGDGAKLCLLLSYYDYDDLRDYMTDEEIMGTPDFDNSVNEIILGGGTGYAILTGEIIYTVRVGDSEYTSTSSAGEYTQVNETFITEISGAVTISYSISGEYTISTIIR